MPEVSIIMPAHNVEAVIGQSIESVQGQTFQDWELLVADEGSSDQTAAIVRSYRDDDPRIHYIGPQAGGAGKAQNTALARIPLERPCIAFLRPGDLWMPEKLDMQLVQLRESGADGVFCSYDAFSSSQESGHAVAVEPVLYRGDAGLIALLEPSRIASLTVLVRRAALEEAGGFPEAPDAPTAAEYGLWLKLLQKGFSLRGYPEVMARLRVQPGTSAADPVTGIRSGLAVLASLPLSTEAAEAARRARVLRMYRELFDILAQRKDKKGIRSHLPALNRALGNPRIGSALSNVLLLPAGIFRRFSWWLFSSLMK